MSLEKMLEMQKQLDDRIVADKGIVWTEEERFRNTLVALDVELSEFANEGRWFKRWSDDQEPRTNVKCKNCCGLGKGFFSGTKYTGLKEICTECEGTGIDINENINPLLEEFVDAVHFFLSLANQKGWGEMLTEDKEVMENYRYLVIKKGLNESYLESKRSLGHLYRHQNSMFHFRTAWIIFLSIGMAHYNFTFQQIEEAYCAKNKMNHERQDNGY